VARRHARCPWQRVEREASERGTAQIAIQAQESERSVDVEQERNPPQGPTHLAQQIDDGFLGAAVTETEQQRMLFLHAAQ